MKKNTISYQKLSIAAILVIIGFFLFPQKVYHPQLPQACYKEICYNLEIADNQDLRQNGLMFRENLSEDAGMIFVFEKELINKFWMKNTIIPLDMIRLNSGLQVLHIENAMPCKQDPCPIYGPNLPSQYVLEINGGLAQKIGLQVGDFIEKRGKREN